MNFIPRSSPISALEQRALAALKEWSDGDCSLLDIEEILAQVYHRRRVDEGNDDEPVLTKSEPVRHLKPTMQEVDQNLLAEKMKLEARMRVVEEQLVQRAIEESVAYAQMEHHHGYQGQGLGNFSSSSSSSSSSSMYPRAGGSGMPFRSQGSSCAGAAAEEPDYRITSDLSPRAEFESPFDMQCFLGEDDIDPADLETILFGKKYNVEPFRFDNSRRSSNRLNNIYCGLCSNKYSNPILSSHLNIKHSLLTIFENNALRSALQRFTSAMRSGSINTSLR